MKSSLATNADAVVREDLDFIVERANAEMEQMSGQRLLVVGGAGFLGHFLVQSPLHWNAAHPNRAPIHVTVLDNYARGLPGWLKRIESNPSLELVQHDIVKPVPETAAAFQFIIHAASIASPIYYRKHPLETMDANVGGLRNLLDYGLRQAKSGSPLSGFLFFSSSEIYGDPPPDQIPTPETYRGNVSCTGPRACYDEAKRYGETLCVTFASQHGLPAKVARPFNNYGPGLKITDRRVIPDFAADILAGRDIVMFSDGSATRTFCYVADAVCGYYKILVNGRPGEAYNIGVEEPEISMLNLAEKMAALGGELFGYKGKVVRQQSGDKDYVTDNPNRRCPVLTKARSELGYDPQVSLAEGLRRSLLWYAQNREAAEG
ncbi:MAG TPA: NAD-dependent epimerase/dehydratase family protein [Chthoniobacterales bacterium]|nr:NAD-dependent epimerase/dehydratase family protein [Chthoniobacterales bacterium]